MNSSNENDTLDSSSDFTSEAEVSGYAHELAAHAESDQDTDMLSELLEESVDDSSDIPRLDLSHTRFKAFDGQFSNVVDVFRGQGFPVVKLADDSEVQLAGYIKPRTVEDTKALRQVEREGKKFRCTQMTCQDHPWVWGIISTAIIVATGASSVANTFLMSPFSSIAFTRANTTFFPLGDRIVDKATSDYEFSYNVSLAVLIICVTAVILGVDVATILYLARQPALEYAVLPVAEPDIDDELSYSTEGSDTENPNKPREKTPLLTACQIESCYSVESPKHALPVIEHDGRYFELRLPYLPLSKTQPDLANIRDRFQDEILPELRNALEINPGEVEGIQENDYVKRPSPLYLQRQAMLERELQAVEELLHSNIASGRAEQQGSTVVARAFDTANEINNDVDVADGAIKVARALADMMLTAAPADSSDGELLQNPRLTQQQTKLYAVSQNLAELLSNPNESSGNDSSEFYVEPGATQSEKQARRLHKAASSCKQRLQSWRRSCGEKKRRRKQAQWEDVALTPRKESNMEPNFSRASSSYSS